MPCRLWISQFLFTVLLLTPLASLWGAEDLSLEVRRSTEQFAKAFDQGNAKELAVLFAEKGEFIDEQGTVYQGRTEVADLLTKFFARFTGATLSIEIESIRSVAPGIAIEEGSRTVTTKEGTARAEVRYTAVKTKVGDRWEIASLREFNDDPAPSTQDRLQSLAWLVGDWVNEGSDAVVRISYRWSEDKNYLLADYSVQAQGKPLLNSTQRIAWDSAAQKFRSWLFDADGGFSEGVWTPVETGWIVKSTTVLADGRTGSATLRYTIQGKDRFLLAGTDRLIGDEQAPNFEVTVVKKPAADKPAAVKKGN